MNHSLMTADRTTHLKIVCLALIAGLGVVGVGLSTRTDAPQAAVKAEQVIVKASKTTTFTSRDITVR